MNKKLLRAQIISAIRDFFHRQNFIETDTPSLVVSPGMEPHIRPVQIQDKNAFLPTSPEFAMKKLMAQGLDKIFQICKAYRFEPKSSTHNPEFTILEWYRTNSDYRVIMNDVENLFQNICQKIHGDLKFSIHGKTQDLKSPWTKLSIEECFKKFAKKDLRAMIPSENASSLEKETFNDDFFKIWLNDIEPKFKTLSSPLIVFDYPHTQAALSNTYRDPQGMLWAKRFEVYAGGFEIANAFDELTDAKIQRKRFIEDQLTRKEIYKNQYPESPLDEELLSALGKIPPSGGIALGVDRLVMYFTGAENIEDVLWLPSAW